MSKYPLELLQRTISSELSNNEIKTLMDSDVVQKGMTKIKRSDLLPFLFQINSNPYSLYDFPQFKPMYDGEYVPETLYMCGRQVAKSTNLSRYEVMNCLMIPHYQILYVAPLQSQTHRYSTLYLKEAINSCPFARYLQDKPQTKDVGSIMKAVGHQTFGNGAGIQLTYAKTSADRARGIFCDQIDCDEIQDHLIDNLAIILQSLTQSKYGIRRYTGTAKTIDNTIEYLWQESSQSEWVVKCGSCNHWNIPTLDGNVLDMIQMIGPCCVNCGRRLDVRKGQIVHKYPDRAKRFAGYHIPQVVVPAITESPRKWANLVDKAQKQPITTVLQEILGLSSSVGARLISQEDIDNSCVLPSMVELQKNLGNYVARISGVDWGIAEQTSFTVHTVIGIRRDGKIDVLWAKRFAGFDPDEVLNQIAQTHRFYKAGILAADFGVGYDKNLMLANRFGLPVVQIQYARQNQLMNYRPILDNPRWVIDKTTALEIMFWGIKYGHFHFPPLDEFKTFSDDLLSPYEEVSDASGMEYRRFVRNPASPDDFAHALCFAMLAAIKSTGCSLLDLIPEGAMGADTATEAQPEMTHVDPREMLKSLA